MDTESVLDLGQRDEIQSCIDSIATPTKFNVFVLFLRQILFPNMLNGRTGVMFHSKRWRKTKDNVLLCRQMAALTIHRVQTAHGY